MYLMIENIGVAPIEAVTLLGVSTSRNSEDENVIGLFGSGVKQGINTLLRHDINPIIFSGNDKLEFFVKPILVKDDLGKNEYGQVYYLLNGKSYPLGFVLEYGEQDWTSVDMALREFVSNALDRSYKEYGTIDGASLKIVSTADMGPSEGYTRVFVPVSPPVQAYYRKIHIHFLQFSSNYDKDKTIIRKRDKSTCRIYRKGVFVREIKENSLFDYNFQNVKIDESRNLDDYSVKMHISQAIRHAEVDDLKILFSSLIKGEDSLESELSDYFVRPDLEQDKIRWSTAWNELVGEKILTDNNNFIIEHVRRKGYSVVIVDGKWANMLKKCNVKSYSDIFGQISNHGVMPQPPTFELEQMVDEIWEKIDSWGLTNNKIRPKCMCFEKPTDGGTKLSGLCTNNVIYVNKDIADGKSEYLAETVLEELTHYITGSTDLSVDFQNYIIKIAIKSMFETDY